MQFSLHDHAAPNYFICFLSLPYFLSLHSSVSGVLHEPLKILQWETQREKETDRQRERVFFYYYTLPQLFSFFLLLCFVSFIHYICYPPHCHLPLHFSFLSVFLGLFKQSLFSFCSWAECLSLGLNYFWSSHFLCRQKVSWVTIHIIKYSLINVTHHTTNTLKLNIFWCSCVRGKDEETDSP